jgi:hypothetical protein
MRLTCTEAIVIAALIALGLYLSRKRVKRNRWLPDPEPDNRDSIGQFRRVVKRS